MRNKFYFRILLLFLYFLSVAGCNTNTSPDMLLINGKIITVDKDCTIAEAVAVKGDKIAAVGSTREILRLSGKETKVIDLKGKTVIPGLIDAHLHPESAALSELHCEIPDLHTVGELLTWIRSQAEGKKEGEWIIHPKLFYTRLEELRPPTLEELDEAAPNNPVFLNGSFGGMINSRAMNISDISEKTIHPGIIHDKPTGRLTGFIRASAFRLLKIPVEEAVSEEKMLNAVEAMLKRYNRYGITGVCSGEGDYRTYEMYRYLHKNGRLTVRIFQNILLTPGPEGSLKTLLDTIPQCNYATGYGDEWVKIGALKIMLDGGILTGTAYLAEPWGDKAADVFGIEEPDYRGVLKYSRDEVFSAVKAAAENNWKFTAHCTGDGGIDILLDVFEEVNKTISVNGRRFSIIHGNFYNEAAIRKMSRLGIYADMQPAWFYKDADAMRMILGENRIRYFHPYHSMVNAGIMVNGGSDHMVKWDANTSVNPYNPFLGMWTMITRRTEKGSVILPEEAITREEALKMYTINNAYASFEENIKGSIEPGKLADMAVISDDILTCPSEAIKNIVSELTLTGGKVVYSSGVLEYQ
jgi:predicted amidohydrolase YtcJ